MNKRDIGLTAYIVGMIVGCMGTVIVLGMVNIGAAIKQPKQQPTIVILSPQQSSDVNKIIQKIDERIADKVILKGFANEKR